MSTSFPVVQEVREVWGVFRVNRRGHQRIEPTLIEIHETESAASRRKTEEQRRNSLLYGTANFEVRSLSAIKVDGMWYHPTTSIIE